MQDFTEPALKTGSALYLIRGNFCKSQKSNFANLKRIGTKKSRKFMRFSVDLHFWISVRSTPLPMSARCRWLYFVKFSICFLFFVLIF